MIRDELDALLQEEDRRLARETRRTATSRREGGGATGDVAGVAELNVRKPLKGLWESESGQGGKAHEEYEMQKTVMERAIEKMEQRLAEQREKYDFVPVQKKRDKDAMLGDWAWLCVYCLLLGIPQYFLNHGNALSQLAALLLVVFWVGGFVKLVKQDVDQTFRYMVRSGSKRVDAYVEARKIATYEKLTDYYYGNISKVKERLEAIKRLDARLEKEKRLTESEMQLVRDALELHLTENVYKNETLFGLRDWLSFRTVGR